MKTLPPSPAPAPNSNADTVFWAGLALAVGAAGVVVASGFYAASPVAAALPMPAPSLATALSGALTGRATLLAAGTIGMISDVILAGGTLVLMAFRSPARLSLERVGWALITLSVLIFVGVDALASGVLTQVAALDGAAAAFAGFKLLFDTLFILGTLTLGLGVPAILVSELRSPTPVLARPLIWLGLAAAAVGLVAGLLYFAGVSLPQVIGLSIAGGSLVSAIYGTQIARAARRSPLG
jgi:hypothetical protein